VVIDAKERVRPDQLHVVVDLQTGAVAQEVTVVLKDGRRLNADWVRTDRMSDLAILKVTASGLVEAPLGDSDTSDVGDWVLAIGSPRGLEQSVSAGIISAKGRPGFYAGGRRPGGRQPQRSVIQTDAAINRGNSGGPLVNMHGEVIGINEAIFSTGGGFEGIGFAIPSNAIKTVH